MTETPEAEREPGWLTRMAEHPTAWQTLTALPLALRRQLLFTSSHKRLGNFTHPRTFSEKINWRILHDRRPILSWTCDKLRMKSVAAERGITALPALWAGTDLNELRSVRLPSAWVLKPNNRSNGLIFFGESQNAPLEDIRRIAENWESNTRLSVLGEWAYKQADPGFIVEERIGPVPGSPPDFKVFVFDGNPYMIQVDTDRFTRHCRTLYSLGWDPMPFQSSYPLADGIPKPDCLSELLEAATAMAAGFDFLRVDLYVERSQVYLGEVTPYPDGGLRPFRPRQGDLAMGSLWSLPRLTRDAES
jgi:TupA-like ATPgrasp